MGAQNGKDLLIKVDMTSDGASVVVTSGAVATPGPVEPARLQLAQNRPNPVGTNGTWISFYLPTEAGVRLEILDVQGRVVRTLASSLQARGPHAEYWDGRNDLSYQGWWMGPEIGGNAVWAYQPGNTVIPLAGEWRVQGIVDNTIEVKLHPIDQTLGSQLCFFHDETGIRCLNPKPYRDMCKTHCRQFHRDCERHNCACETQQDEKTRKDRASRRPGATSSAARRAWPTCAGCWASPNARCPTATR